MPKLVPSNPSEVMVIREVVPGVIVTMSTPFSRFGLIKVGGRGTVVKLQSGGLAVFSPTALTPEVKEVVANLGEVKYLAAPDREHHIFLGPWHEAFPEAKIIGPEGLPEKKAKGDNVPFHTVFEAAKKSSIKIDPEFDAEFDYEYVNVHPNKEIVFCHKPTKTLIEADLIFNLPATEQYSKSGESATSGIFTKLFGALQHTSGSAIGQKRIAWYGYSAENRPAFNKSIARINSWDFDRLIPCHGDTIETGAKAVFQKVLGWHL